MRTWQTIVLGIAFLVGSAIPMFNGPDWLNWIGKALVTLGGSGGLASAALDTKRTREHVEGQIRSMRAA